MITITIHMKALPAKRKELLQTVEFLVAETQNESGCLSAYCYQEIADENTFLLIEQWSSQKDAEAHMSSDMFTVLKGAGSFMLQKPAIVIQSVVQTELLGS